MICVRQKFLYGCQILRLFVTSWGIEWRALECLSMAAACRRHPQVGKHKVENTMAYDD